MKYSLIRPCAVQKYFGVEFFESYLVDSLGESYVPYPEDTEKKSIRTTETFRELHSANGETDIKVIDLILNPYNRAFLYYLDNTTTLDGSASYEEIMAVTSMDAFREFMVNDFYVKKENHRLVNHSSGIRTGIDYLISAESYATDLKKIPELADKDTEVALKSCACLYNNMYREYYDAECKNIVEEVYAQDLEVYGYTF